MCVHTRFRLQGSNASHASDKDYYVLILGENVGFTDDASFSSTLFIQFRASTLICSPNRFEGLCITHQPLSVKPTDRCSLPYVCLFPPSSWLLLPLSRVFSLSRICSTARWLARARLIMYLSRSPELFCCSLSFWLSSSLWELSSSSLMKKSL